MGRCSTLQGVQLRALWWPRGEGWGRRSGRRVPKGREICIHIIEVIITLELGFPCGARGKESICQCRRCKRWRGLDLWVGKIPWSRKWQPTSVFLPGKFHGQRSLEGYSPWGHKESDTTEHACMHAPKIKGVSDHQNWLQRFSWKPGVIISQIHFTCFH